MDYGPAKRALGGAGDLDERLYAKSRGQLASIVSAIRIKVTSLRVVLGFPSGSGHHDSSRRECQEIRSRALQAATLEGDAEREVERAARADERARELEVGTRVDEEPRVLFAKPQLAELVEAPADHALILEGDLVCWGWVLGCGHVPALTTGCLASLLAERKAWLRVVG